MKAVRGEQRLMKRVIVIALILLLIPAVAYADSIGDIIPDTGLWGISQKAFKAQNASDFSECKIGNKKGLMISDVEVDTYAMDCYYVFGEKMNDSKGWTYSGLSKITYILNDSEIFEDEFATCYDTLVADLTEVIGEPDSVKKSVATWNKDRYKIEIGKAKVSKYTGSDQTTVVIVISGIDIPKPTVAPTSTPKPTPTPRPTRKPTVKPTATPKPDYQTIDYKGVSRYPDRYKGQYVKFTGIVVQAQETYGVAYEGGSYFDNYYILRVASKYEKYKYYDGYSTDDIVYVVVPVSKVEGGRILDDDKVSIYGRYDGIETYKTVLGAAVSIPRIEANRVVIK